MIPMYRLRLHGLYGLYGPRCPLSPEMPLSLITHSTKIKLIYLRFIVLQIVAMEKVICYVLLAIFCVCILSSLYYKCGAFVSVDAMYIYTHSIG